MFRVCARRTSRCTTHDARAAHMHRTQSSQQQMADGGSETEMRKVVGLVDDCVGLTHPSSSLRKVGLVSFWQNYM